MVNTYYPGRLRNNSYNVSPITASSYTATTDDGVLICDATSASVTIVLPTASTAQNKSWIIKKKDSSANAVFITGTIDGYTNWALAVQNDWVEIATDGTSFYFTDGNAIPMLYRSFGRNTVLLTAVATPTLFTVPTGRTLYVDDVRLEGLVTISGGTSSKLIAGTTANSYNELMNGTTGFTFVSGTATTLLAVGSAVRFNDFTAPATMSVSNVSKFAAGTVIKASVSGTVVTAGSINMELLGYLI